jgi:hypothetical protein
MINIDKLREWNLPLRINWRDINGLQHDEKIDLSSHYPGETFHNMTYQLSYSDKPLHLGPIYYLKVIAHVKDTTGSLNDWVLASFYVSEKGISINNQPKQYKRNHATHKFEGLTWQIIASSINHPNNSSPIVEELGRELLELLNGLANRWEISPDLIMSMPVDD